MADTGQDGMAFASRLNRLVDAGRQSDGTPWSNAALAKAVTALGVPTSASNLSLLRSGRRSNPSAALVDALAAVFGVPVDFFFGRTSEEWDRELETVLALRRAGVRSVTTRAAQLSDAGLAKLAEMADYLASIENPDQGT